MAKVSIKIPIEDPYDVSIEPGLLDRLGDVLAAIVPSRRAVILSDLNVATIYLPRVQRSIEKLDIEVIAATLPSGENNKTLAILLPVYDMLLSHGMERTTPVIALGGGIVGDMAGFVAATVLRGVPLVQVPTTLLAMVDASIGGKTGVNHSIGKNLIGAFHQPRAVLIDPMVLRTLPQDELRNGLAECIKHDLIRDAEAFAQLEQQIDRALQLDIDYLTHLIAHNVSIKKSIVEQDPFEQADRALLNFGHTFAHAIEIASNHSYSHGQAVALGMIAAATLSRMLSLIDDDAVQRIRNLIERAGLPTGGLQLDLQKIVSAMASDKKIQSKRLRFILLQGIGQATIRDDIPIEQVRAALASICD